MRQFYAFKFYASMPEDERPVDKNGVPVPETCLMADAMVSEDLIMVPKLNEQNEPLVVDGVLQVDHYDKGPYQLDLEAQGYTIEEDLQAGEVMLEAAKEEMLQWAANVAPIVPPPPPAEVVVGELIQKASAFGSALVLEFGKRNVLLGKNAGQIDSIMESSDVRALMAACQSGSLQYAKRKAVAMELPAGITEEDRAWFIAKLNVFLKE